MCKKSPDSIEIYQTAKGSLELRGDPSGDTIWATLNQIAELFGRDKSVISRHIKNIFNSNELDEGSVITQKVEVKPTSTYRYLLFGTVNVSGANQYNSG